MGNYKFKLSDMMPNAWFFKLKDMARTKTRSQTENQKNTQTTKKNHHAKAAAAPPLPPSLLTPEQEAVAGPDSSDERKSYHFTRDIKFQSKSSSRTSVHMHYSEPPRKSHGKRRSIKKTRTNPATLQRSDDNLNSSFDPRICRTTQNDIVFDLEEKSFHAKSDGSDYGSGLNLRPIITKPDRIRDTEENPKRVASLPVKMNRVSSKFEEGNAYGSQADSKEQRSGSFRMHPPGVKLRPRNSPRIGIRNNPSRKSASSTSSSSSWTENFAVVKSSKDPQRDFRESMVMMIVENNIRDSKDLEELLACYLSLNSIEYHDVIIKVFKQIWLDSADEIRHKS